MNWRHFRIFNKGVLNTESVGIGKEASGTLRDAQNVRLRSGSIKQRDGSSVAVDFSAIAGGVDIVRLWEAALEGQTGGVWEFWYAYVFSSGVKLYYHDTSDNTTVVVTSTLSNPDIWTVNVFDNQFVSNKEDEIHIHAGSPGSWVPVGLDAPTVAPTAGALIGGALTGLKSYKYTYVRKTAVGIPYEMESNASDILTVEYTAEQTTITMTASLEAHATHFRLYATVLDDPVDTEFWLLSEQAIAVTTYVDNLNTNVITAFDTSDRGKPPAGGQMLWQDNRLYVVGNAANKSIIYYSDLGRPFYFPDKNWDEVSRDDGQEIAGLASLGHTRYIFKTTSIYEWTGDPTLVTPITDISQSSQSQNQNAVGIGCADPLSIAQTSDYVIFRASDDHVYKLSRTSFIKLSAGQETDVGELAADSTGAIYDNYYILHSDGTTLVWDLSTDTYVGKDTGVTTGKFLIDHNGDLMYGNEDEIIQLYDPAETDDKDGADFTKMAQFPYSRMAEDEEEATVRRVRATTSSRDTDFTFTTFNENGQIDSGVNVFGDRHYSLPRGARGQYISVRAEWTDTAIIESIGIGFLKRGRRH